MINALHGGRSRPLDNRHNEFNDGGSYTAALLRADPEVPDDGGVMLEQIKVRLGAEVAACPCRIVAR